MTPPTSMRRESPQPSGATPPSDEPINTSDNESGGEKPVREKLRDTRIANQANEEDMTTSPGSSAGRLRRKRSLEDIQDDEDNDEELGKLGKHARKRSRSATPEDKMDSVEEGTPQVVTNGSRDRRSITPELSSGKAEETQPAGLASPKNKRTRDQVSKDEEGATTISGNGPLATRAADKYNKLPGDDRQTKRHRDSGSPESVTAQGATKVGLDVFLKSKTIEQKKHCIEAQNS
jgi:Ran-binding protein 3